MVETVAVGFSSINQCPECGMTTSWTLLAAARMTTAVIGPNDASPPPPARHGQHALGQERPVVDGILIEGLELLEAGMHGSRKGVQPGVVPA